MAVAELSQRIPVDEIFTEVDLRERALVLQTRSHFANAGESGLMFLVLGKTGDEVMEMLQKGQLFLRWVLVDYKHWCYGVDPATLKLAFHPGEIFTRAAANYRRPKTTKDELTKLAAYDMREMAWKLVKTTQSLLSQTRADEQALKSAVGDFKKVSRPYVVSAWEAREDFFQERLPRFYLERLSQSLAKNISSPLDER